MRFSFTSLGIVLKITRMRHLIVIVMTGLALDAILAPLRLPLKVTWERSLKILLVADAKTPVGVATHWGSVRTASKTPVGVVTHWGTVDIIKTRTGTSGHHQDPYGHVHP